MSTNPISTMSMGLQEAGRKPQEEQRDLPRPYKCPICPKAFHRLEHQTRHIRTHTGEKPHACTHSGCSKRFSRSDELTRHLRIHSNPNSRRSRNAARFVNTSPHSALDSQLMPPPVAIRSAPSSSMPSPNVSPPNHYISYANSNAICTSFGDAPGGGASSSGTSTPNRYLRPPPFSGLLASATSQIERHRLDRDAVPPHISRLQHLPHTYTAPKHTGTSLAQYSISTHHNHYHHYYNHHNHNHNHAMARSHSHDPDDNPYSSHRATKRSRPSSPFSTAPPSPTFSHDSASPTPDHTPIITPAHSPRMRPLLDVGMGMGMGMGAHHHLVPPSLKMRTLSLKQHGPPALAPMEPSAEAATAASVNMPGMAFGWGARPPTSNSTGPFAAGGFKISDILEQPDASRRRLPVPRVAVSDLLNAPPAPPGFVSDGISGRN